MKAVHGENDHAIVKNRFVSFWLDDLPPLSGRMRAVFYSGLLFLGLTQSSPLSLATVLAGCDSDLVSPVEFVRWSGMDRWNAETILLIRNICIFSWVLAAIGLCTQPAKIATAACIVPLHALSIGIHNSHGWYVPVYALVFLCLSRSDSDFSLDAIIRKKWTSWPGEAPSPSSLGATGLARKLVLLVAVHTLFAGGVSKLLEGGWQWMDGHTLQSYISLTWECLGTQPRLPWVADAILSSMSLAVFCSVAAVIVELASLAALFSGRARNIVVAGALAFHLVIYLVMAPRFVEQSWCYLLLVDWGRLGDRARRFLGSIPRSVTPSAARRPSWTAPHAALMASVASTAFSVVLLFTVFRGVESWPLTCVPMYSSYVGPDRVSNVPRDFFESTDGLRALALKTKGPIPWAWRMVFWPKLTLELVGQHETADVKSILPGAGGLGFYSWFFILTDVAMQQIATPRQAGAEHRFDPEEVMNAIKAHAAAKGMSLEGAEVRLAYLFSTGEPPLVLAESD